MPWKCVALMVGALCAGCSTMESRAARHAEAVTIQVGPFGPAAAAGHQTLIQQCLDSSQGRPAIFRFAPGDYVFTGPEGVRVPARATLLMEGARFLLTDSIARDGQAFLLDNVSNAVLRGGEILGCRDAWDPGTNVAGIRVQGGAGNVSISDLLCRDLSSNAVGIFGADGAEPVRNVVLTRVTGINCCNAYTDYLLPNKGPAPGSDRRDQGTVALYNVDGWAVDACRFEGSQSDGTHFFHCRNGRFMNCSVTGSRMGGYFLEGCEHVAASGNLILGNGSRGVTIERDSRFCVFSDNIVAHSGREGLWMPDVEAVIITGNIFQENGRKDDGEKDCEIRIDDTLEYPTKTRDLRIEGNILRTAARQTAALITGPGVAAPAMENNTFTGPAPRCGAANGTS